MNPPGHSRDLYRAESADIADRARTYLRAQSELFVPTPEVARALGVNPNRLGHALRGYPATFQVERAYREGTQVSVVALRPAHRSSSSSS